MRWRPDPFIVALLVAAVVATWWGPGGWLIEVFQLATQVAIGVLFFMYGTRLSTQQTWSGIRNWKLQLVVLATTFVVFPIFGVVLQSVAGRFVSPALAAGLLLLCLVPSTIQSSIVNTRIAGGDVAAAVVAASISNLIGVFATPALVAWLMSTDARVDASSVLRIIAQLLAPFILGQLLRPWLGDWVDRHDTRLKLFDRATIVMVVFVAFALGAEAGIWSAVNAHDLIITALACSALLVVVLGWCVLLGRLGGFEPAQRWPILFCGSTKSLASGLPIASVLFPATSVALLVLPLMIYHQLQIIVTSIIATRAASRG